MDAPVEALNPLGSSIAPSDAAARHETRTLVAVRDTSVSTSCDGGGEIPVATVLSGTVLQVTESVVSGFGEARVSGMQQCLAGCAPASDTRTNAVTAAELH
eukprot:SAG22_NODE_142_length_17922_cov_10.990406_21_plen_101_part_00